MLRFLAALLLTSSALAFDSVALFPNGNFETATTNPDWPDHWLQPKSGGTREKEDSGNHFIRLRSPEPNSTVMLYQEISIPSDVEAIEVSWRHRLTNLKKGKNSWFDARLMLEFLDANRAKLSPGPKTLNFGKDHPEWQTSSLQFLVPKDAKFLKFMPALLQVQSGTWDLDDIVIQSIDSTPVRATAEKAAAERAVEMAKRLVARRAKARANLPADGSIIPNGNFETDKDNNQWPDKWAHPKQGAAWETEEAPDAQSNRFLRLNAYQPDTMLSLYQMYDIPEGIAALELSFKQRITSLKRGAKPWYDARIIIEFKGADGKTLPSKPSPAYSQRDTKGWVEKTTSFLVPPDAAAVVVMPALFQVKAGTFDLDDITLKATDSAPILARQKERAAAIVKARVPLEKDDASKWPAQLRVEGNRLVTVDGGKEIWLQGMNVPSLEWSLRGEQIHKSVVVAIDEWKANVIRLPVKDDYWFGKEAEDGGKAYRETIDQAITLAANRGAYLVLDLHRYRAPRKEYLAFWTDAATRYKNHPAIIFDLLNEPHGISWELWRDGGFIEEKRKDGDEDAFLTPEEKLHNKHGFQSPGMQAMLDAVRATGAKNLVLVGGLDYAYELDGIVNGFGLKDDNGHGIIYACHIYPWKRNWQKKLLDAAALHPILLGEVGADEKKMDFLPLESQEDPATWVPDILGLIQKHKLNWTGWCFHPGATPRLLLDWDYTPTPFWGQPAKDALSGKSFELKKLR